LGLRQMDRRYTEKYYRVFGTKVKCPKKAQTGDRSQIAMQNDLTLKEFRNSVNAFCFLCESSNTAHLFGDIKLQHG
jgi:hypothetical protein